MSATRRLTLPLLAAGQSQKHVTLNEALLRLDETIQILIASRSLMDPPASPAEGRSYVPAAGASGAWAGKAGFLLVFEDGVWRTISVPAGTSAYIEDEEAVVVHDGAAWRTPKGRNAEARIDRLGLARAPDDTAALAVTSDRAIFSHAPAAGGDMRMIVNKADTADTASLVLQTGWSGRGEFGLCGDDKLSLKVSANGTSWLTALSVDNASGDVAAPGRLVVGSGAALVNGLTIARPGGSVAIKDTQGVGDAHVAVASFIDANGDEKVWMGLGSAGNSEFTFLSQYADGITFYAYGGNHPIRFLQNGATRLRIHTNGNVGIGETAPTAPLHIGGAARVGSYSRTSLPSANGLGAGAIIFVTDDSAGATLAFSDGSGWRRAHDRQIVA
jgi:hypothetical protein